MSEVGRLPPRPTIPPALYALAAAFPVAQLVLRRVASGPALVLAGVLALAIAVLACRSFPAMRQTVVLVGLCCTLVALGAAVAAARVSALEGMLRTTPVSRLAFAVETDPTEGQVGWRSRATVVKEGSDLGSVWIVTPSPVSRGEVVEGVGRFAPPGDDEWSLSGLGRGVAGTVTLVRVTGARDAEGPLAVLLGLREGVLDAISPGEGDGRALLAGCVCGSRSGLVARGLDDDFSTCGLAHLIAVSGAHLAVLSSMLSRALSATSARPRSRVLALAVLTGAFVLFCGAPASAVRSWAMVLVANGSQLAGRRSYGLSSVSLAGLAMVAANPAATGDLGFQLSVLSVTGLSLFGRYAEYALGEACAPIRGMASGRGRARRVLRSLGRYAVNASSSSLVAQVVTLPVTLPTFSSIPVAGPLSNLLVGPFFQPFVAFGTLACVFARVPVVGDSMLALSDCLALPVIVAARRIARLPLASVAASGDVLPVCVAVVLGMVALLVWWPRVSPRALRVGLLALALVLAVCLARCRWFAPARVVVLDVGQGDAILVQDGASALLVDAGPPDEAVAAALAREGVWHLDAVLLTHMHDDHYGGLASLPGHVAVDRVLVGEGVSSSLPAEVRECLESLGCPDAVGELRHGDEVRVGGFELRVVWPNGASDGGENSDSVELLLTYSANDAQLTALLTGDAEREQTNAALAAGDVGAVDLLKVGHHGSEVSLDATTLAGLDPTLAVASAGEGNRFGHPTAACVDLLEGADVRFLCTKDVGDVEARPAAGGVAVRCAREPV